MFKNLRAWVILMISTVLLISNTTKNELGKCAHIKSMCAYQVEYDANCISGHPWTILCLLSRDRPALNFWRSI